MSSYHSEAILQKPISEYAKHLKNLLPVNIPETYMLKPIFENIAEEDDIRNGVIAFRDFIHLFFDHLISKGHLYVRPQKTKNPNSYPLLHNINQLLIDIGYHGSLAESADSLLVTDIPSFAASKPKIPVSKQIECLRLLSSCGFVFACIDLEVQTFKFSEVQMFEVSYPSNPILLTGLKALAVASKELSIRFLNDAGDLLRCDYRVMKAEDTNILDVLKDFLHPLPEKVRDFAIKLHLRYTDMGMTCVTISEDQYHFAYSFIKNSRRSLSPRDIYQQRVWEFAISMRFGYCLVVRAKKADRYADVIKKFPQSLQEKITKGYGCDRKLYSEHCQGGCDGIRVPLDESILNIGCDIVTWLDCEILGAPKNK